MPDDAENAKPEVGDLRLAAERREAMAQRLLGVAYAGGDRVAQFDDEAVMWVRKLLWGCRAEENLGKMYFDSSRVSPRASKATSVYCRAAEQGDADAQFRLGLAYEKGKGVQQDSAQAAEWYRKAAEQGHAIAQFMLGVMYGSGDGVPQDLEQSAAWHEREADQGGPLAQYLLGCAYDNGVYRRALDRNADAAGIVIVPSMHNERVSWRKALDSLLETFASL